jgi:hypothetical protein
MAARLEQDLRYWLTTPYSSDDLKPWCEVALGWLMAGEFRAAMGVLWLMKEHLTFVPATLDADEDGWADYTARRGGGPGGVLKELALNRVTAHPLYRTKEEIEAAGEAEAMQMMAEMNAVDDRTADEIIADCNEKIATLVAGV